MQKQLNSGTSTEDIGLLVDRAIEGDASAFGGLYDMYVDRVYRHIFYRTGNTSDAEDITQQTFIKAWKAIGQYKRTDIPFLAWLIKISHNLVIDFYRSGKNKLSVNIDDIDIVSDSNPVQLAESRYNRQQIRQAIGKLKGEQQQVILMRFIEDFSYTEIAATLGKSEGTVRVILHRGLVELRKIIEKVQQ